MSLNFFFEDTVKFRTPTGLKFKLLELIKNENKLPGEISIIFCSDDYLLKMNKDYLKHDYYTDVITFDYSEENIVSGDIFISADRVKENAAKYGVEFKNESIRVMVHGILHLIGYKDKTKEDKKQMTEKEDFYLSKILTPKA
jgi:probable rRNA maturation factor